MHKGLAQKMGRVVGEVARGEVVGAVDDDVVRREHLHRGIGVEVLPDGDHLDVRIEISQRAGSRLDLGAADVVDPVQQLALEVGGVDGVEVHDPHLPHTGGRQVHGRGRAQASRPEQKHARGEQLALTGTAHLGQDQMPGVARDLVGRKASGGSHGTNQYTEAYSLVFLD